MIARTLRSQKNAWMSCRGRALRRNANSNQLAFAAHQLCVADESCRRRSLVYLTHFTVKQRTPCRARSRTWLARACQPRHAAYSLWLASTGAMELLVLLLLFLALPVLPARCGSVTPRRSLHLELARVDAAAAANLTDQELIRRAVQRSLDRPGIVARSGGGAADEAGKAVASEAPLVPGGGEYLVKLGTGTPQHFFSAAIDTASDLVWMQCQPCVSCYRQLDPVFNPKLSSSYAVVPCTSDTCAQLDGHRYVLDDAGLAHCMHHQQGYYYVQSRRKPTDTTHTQTDATRTTMERASTPTSTAGTG